MNDGCIKIATAEPVIAGDGASLDGKGRAGGGRGKTGHKHIARAAAEIEHDNILRLVPNLRASVGEKIIRKCRHGFIEEVEVREDKSAKLGGGERVRPLIDLERGGDGDHSATGR